MNNRNGFALIATILVMLLITVVIGAAVTGAAAALRASNLDYRNSRVFYAAEAGAEAIMAQLHDALEDGSLDDPELASLTPPTLPGFTFSGFKASKVGGSVVERVTDGPFAGLYSLTQRVEIFSEVEDPDFNSSGVIVSAKAQAIPIFQFGIFYEKDLEATNGPPMEFAGWVHSNGHIYLSSRNAWYRDAITTPNKVFWDRKDNHNVFAGVFVNDALGNEVQLNFDSRTHPAPNDFRAESNTRFDDRLKTDAYGVDSLRVPLPTGVDPVEVMRPREGADTPVEQKAKFAWKADWYIEVDLNSLTQSSASDPLEICNAMSHTRGGGLQVPSDPECQTMFRWTYEAFYEGRERRYVDVLDIDVRRLKDWQKANNANRENKILYVTFTGASPITAVTDPSGDRFRPIIRLVNGSEITSAMGFTFATDRPLYVQGDYNSVRWVPAALVGDAITILSNVWSDAAHVNPVVIKTAAAPTQVFAAILAGHSPTPCDHEVAGCPGGYADFYGGGIENFPRFLENWSGITLTYRGSLVSLSFSQIALGTWNGTYYSPPRRDWQFDTRFEDPANLPPGTPVVGNVIHTAFRPAY